MDSARLSLDEVTVQVEADSTIRPTVDTSDSTVVLYDYSRFKYGDSLVATRYGRAMASRLLGHYPEIMDQDEVFVTSSAYKAAPPASHSLVLPFVSSASVTARSRGAATEFMSFKIDRANLTDGDYAAMSIEDRQRIMMQNGLSLPEDVDLKDKTLVVLDDILVTGSHEEMVQKVLERVEPAQVYYGYILRVAEGRRYPTIESAINSLSVRTIYDVIELASRANFAPNARLCKFVLSQSVEDIKRFCKEVPGTVSKQVHAYITGDELQKMESYQAAYDVFSAELQ